MAVAMRLAHWQQNDIICIVTRQLTLLTTELLIVGLSGVAVSDSLHHSQKESGQR